MVCRWFWDTPISTSLPQNRNPAFHVILWCLRFSQAFELGLCHWCVVEPTQGRLRKFHHLFSSDLLLKLSKVARIARILQNEEKMLGQGSESQGFFFVKFSVANWWDKFYFLLAMEEKTFALDWFRLKSWRKKNEANTPVLWGLPGLHTISKGMSVV